MRNAPSPPDSRYSAAPGWDAAVVLLLTFALLQVTSLAESAALPTRVADVIRHPWLGGLLSPGALAAFGEVGPRPGEPIGLLLNALALGLAGLYAVTDLALRGATRQRGKWVLLAGLIVVMVYAPTAKLMLLRAQSGPASYSHDGGVIQTEATIDYFLSGRNPYSEDYTQTPMAEWGFGAYRTALYHYPYLPWTFLFSAPFALLFEQTGGFDERVVYLLLLAAALTLAPRLVAGERKKLALVALLALNPLMALDVIFGQNDVFVLSWIVFSLVALNASRTAASATRARAWTIVAGLLYGLACASKPTAWFLAPFLAILVAPGQGPWLRGLWTGALRLWPALITFLLILLPWLMWDAAALYDDVWRWSSGQGPTGYQIWGWGAANFVLALGGVESRFDQWPFLVLQAALAGPLLLWLVWRQARTNTFAAACWHYALFLLVFFYFSRFLNENYLGYILAFVAIGAILTLDEATSAPTE